MLKRLTKIILILMSQMRDLLREMVTEPLFWPLMLVLAGMFAYATLTACHFIMLPLRPYFAISLCT